jgi:hypothetical protein
LSRKAAASMRNLLIVLVGAALLAGCTYYTKADRPGEAAAPPPPHPMDQGCMSDCVGNGGNKDFCTERCTK